MNLDSILVIFLICVMVVALARNMLRPGLIFFTVVVLFLIFGIVDSTEALSGFSNKGMITVAILFMISEGVRQSGALNYVSRKLMPTQKAPVGVLLIKIMAPIGFFSAFLNNTPLVVIFAPIIKKWAEKSNLPVQKFLIPLSYATILGGMCTLIGTSTNLVVHGLMLDSGYTGIGMFELGKVGIPVAIGGFIYMYIFGNVLLPGDKVTNSNITANYRDYYFDVFVPEQSVFIGEKIEKQKNHLLKDFLIVQIIRGADHIITTKGEFTIKSGDQLLLAGKSDSVEQLLEIQGLKIKCLENQSHSFKNEKVKQFEVVLSPRFPGLGQTLDNFDFYSHYNAVVMAVHRNGERISTNIGDLTLKSGDNLILLATDKFLKDWSESRVFYATSYLGEVAKPFGTRKMWITMLILVGMVLGTSLSRDSYLAGKTSIDMFFFACLAAILMVWTKILPAKEYTKSISWDLLITIAFAFTISKALQNSGAADTLAAFTIDIFKNYGPIGALAGVYIITNLFTEFITNNAAAALVYPIALAAANQLGVDPKPFFIAIAIAASASFSTPIGYQTNLIVQGMGNYKFIDFFRFGLPLNILCFIISLLLIPFMFPF